MRVAILAAKLKHILLMRECLAGVLGCLGFFPNLSPFPSPFFPSLLQFSACLVLSSHFVATCLAAMSTEAENTRKLLAGVQEGPNRDIFNAYMRSGDPMGAMLWAAFSSRCLLTGRALSHLVVLSNY